MNINEKALKVRAKRTELDAQYPEGYCVLVSVQSDTYNTKGGVPMEMPNDNAARHLVEGTHKLATDAELDAFRAAQANALQAARQAELAKRTVHYVPVDTNGQPVVDSKRGK